MTLYGSHSLLQGIFLTQALNLSLMQADFYCLSHQGSPQYYLVCVYLIVFIHQWTLRLLPYLTYYINK